MRGGSPAGINQVMSSKHKGHNTAKSEEFNNAIC